MSRSSSHLQGGDLAGHDRDAARGELLPLLGRQRGAVVQEQRSRRRSAAGTAGPGARAIGWWPARRCAWSRTSQPWQYGQCSTSRPHRSASPGTSGSSSASPVVTSSRRAGDGGPVGQLTAKPGSVLAGDGRAEVTVPVTHLAAVAGHLGAADREQLGRRGAVAGQVVVHARGRGVARAAGVDHQHRRGGTAPAPAPRSARRPAADHHHVVLLVLLGSCPSARRDVAAAACVAVGRRARI